MARTLLPMATQRDYDSPAKNWRKTIITGAGVILALFSLAILGLSSDVRQLRLAVVGALWAFLLVAVTNLPRRTSQVVPQEDEDELKRFYQLELDQEVAARREYELRLEVQLRRELDENRSADLEKIRTDLVQLRTDINGVGPSRGPQRSAIPAGGSIRSLPAGPSARNETSARTNVPTPMPHSPARPRQNAIPRTAASSPSTVGFGSAASANSAPGRINQERDPLAEANSWPDAFNADRKALSAGPGPGTGMRNQPIAQRPALAPIPPATKNVPTLSEPEIISNTGRHHRGAAPETPNSLPTSSPNTVEAGNARLASMAKRDDLQDILGRW